MKKSFPVRFLQAALLLLLASLLLFSCNQPGSPADTTASSTEPPQAQPLTSLSLSDLPSFTIVRPEGKMNITASDFANNLSPLTGKKRLPIITDRLEGDAAPDSSALEILIGKTNRPESMQYYNSLRANDYGYAIIGRKIVICGRTEQMTKKAMELFENDLKAAKDEGKTVLLENTDGNKIVGEYAVTKATLNGNPIGNYVIVYPKDADKTGQDYAKRIADRFHALGYALECVKDSELPASADQLEIRVGITDRTPGLASELSLAGGESYLAYDNGTVTVAGGGDLGFYFAVDHFLSKFAQEEGIIEATMENTYRNKNENENGTMRLMSFNVWVAGATQGRGELVLSVIRDTLPDVFGVQEASPQWMQILKNGLPLYDYVGLGREGGEAGEYSAIFYLRDRYTLLDTGTKWLSDTPDAVSRYPESSYNRIMTYAVLKRNSDGKEFIHVNTHLEHTNEPVRVKQIAVLLNEVSKLGDLPIMMTGDFNTTRGSEVYNALLAAGFTDCAIAFGGENGDKNTFPAGTGSLIIDFCLVRGDFEVKNYEVFQDKVGAEYPSDHNPIWTDLVL